jgi:Txe/YoeB family toxin of Txe-Axe toxin-antitoxin module
MRLISFDRKAFEEYQEWIIVDRKIAIKIGEQNRRCFKKPFYWLGKA